ncbi:MAG: signal peptide peptidase SppA, partial [Terriglobales bacterium]
GAVKDTASSVNISGEPSLVWPPKEKRPGLGDLLFGDLSSYLPSREKLLEQQVGFYYLWK